MSTFSPPSPPSANERDARALELMAWGAAPQILGRRPWLTVSWLKRPEMGGGHLVVHDGASGAALHFDHPEGPTLGGASLEATPLDWGDIPTDVEASVKQEADEYFVDWAAHWGRLTPEPVRSDRLAVFAGLRSCLTGADISANDVQRQTMSAVLEKGAADGLAQMDGR